MTLIGALSFFREPGEMSPTNALGVIHADPEFRENGGLR